MRWEHHSFFIPSDHCFRQCWCFAGFEVTLKFGMKQLLHFRGFICLKATLCYVNTLSNWKIPSCIYGRTCYTFRYYLEKLWLLMWAFHRPWWCFSLSIQDCKLGENHRQKWKFERQFFLAEIPGLWLKEKVPVFVFHHIVSVEENGYRCYRNSCLLVVKILNSN